MDALQQIIHSLTPNEKRYFKVFAAAFKEESALLKLFAAMDEAEDYNEAKIKAASGIKDLTKAKSNLRKLLLKAMRNYNEEENAHRQLRDALADIDFLKRKGLYEEARKEVHKAWKIAEKFEVHHYGAELLYRISEINDLTLKEDKLAKDFSALSLMMKETIAKLQDVYISGLKNHYISTVVRRGDEEGTADFFNSCIDDLRQQLKGNRSKHAEVSLTLTIAICYQVQGKLNEAVDTYAEAHKLLKNTPSLIDINPGIYLSFLINYGILAASESSMKKKAEELINETQRAFVQLKDFFEGRPDKVVHFQARLTGNKLSYVKTNGLWNKLPELELEVKRHLEGEKQKVVGALQAAVMISCYVRKGDPEKALQWVNTYYMLDDSKVLKPLMICVRVMEVLAYHNKGQLDVSDTKAVNLYKTLLEQGHTEEFYRNLGTLLRKLNHWNGAESDHKEKEKLKLLFARLKNENDPLYRIYEEFFEPVEILTAAKKKSVLI